jgi:dTMP kinase
MSKGKARFIVIEGLDGSGKTEVINRLKKDFSSFLYTREPGGTVFGEMVRNVLLDSKSKNVPPLPMLLGFVSSRASHVQELIIPSLKKGVNVVSDRFDASTFSFQLNYL